MTFVNEKPRKRVLFLVVIIGLSLLFSTAALAGPFTPDTWCEAKGGTWSGTSGVSATGTCTFSPGTYPDSPLCPSGHTTLTFYVGGANGLSGCVAPAYSGPPSPGPATLGKCKLLSIDSPVAVGETFSATWIGGLESLRFRRTLAGPYFISPLAGTFHYENGHRAGDFSMFGLDRGRWEVTCWGSDGTFGTAKIVFVQ